MGTKFKIYKHRKSENLHLQLMGEFNDVSVCELIDVLRDNYKDVVKVFINTSSLNRISTSVIGRDVFNKNIHDLSDSSFNIQFTGGQEAKLWP